MLNKDQIKAAKDRPREFLPIPEWTPEGETHDPTKHGVYIGMMGVRQRETLTTRYKESREDNTVFLTTLAICTVQNEDGSPMFDASDAEWLAEKAEAPLKAIALKALALNKMLADDQSALVKN